MINSTAPTQNTVNREYTLLAAWEQFRLGFDYFTSGQDVTVCANMQQRRGYFAALAAQADTETYAYLAQRKQNETL